MRAPYEGGRTSEGHEWHVRWKSGIEPRLLMGSSNVRVGQLATESAWWSFRLPGGKAMLRLVCVRGTVWAPRWMRRCGVWGCDAVMTRLLPISRKMRHCQAWPRGGQPRHGRRLKDSVNARRSDKTSLYAAGRCSLPMCLGPRASRFGQGAMITGCARAVRCAAEERARVRSGPRVRRPRAPIWWTACSLGGQSCLQGRHAESQIIVSYRILSDRIDRQTDRRTDHYSVCLTDRPNLTAPMLGRS